MPCYNDDQQINGTTGILTPCRSETSENFITKLSILIIRPAVQHARQFYDNRPTNRWNITSCDKKRGRERKGKKKKEGVFLFTFLSFFRKTAGLYRMDSGHARFCVSCALYVVDLDSGCWVGLSQLRYAFPC